MSLIDDALKRAQAAGQPAAAGPPAERPWVPAPLPDAGPARRRRLARIATAVLAILAAAGAGVWFLRKAPAERPVSPLRQAQLPESSAVTAPPLAAAFPTVSVPPAQAAAKLRPTRLPAPTGGDPGESAPASAAPDPPAPRAQILVDGKTYAGSVLLPGGAKVELGGIVWSEAEPRALLNDRIAGVGAWVEGFTVAKIEPERVVLERDGLSIFLSLK